MAQYVIGADLQVSVSITNKAGAATDPTALTVMVRSPSGVETTYIYGTDMALVRDGTGVYHLDIDLDAPGIWRYYWFCTGTVQAASIGSCTVLASGM